MPDCDLRSNNFNLRLDCTVLPIKLSSFTAYKKDATAELKLTTEKEIQNRGFYIERSNNGSTWLNLGFVASKAADKNSSTKLDYSFIDKKPLNGNNNYRLKQIDLDGTIE